MDRIVTERLILRPFDQRDAEDVFSYAADPRVGPIAGWPPHKSVEESREILRTVLSAPGVFAMQLKDSGRVVGSVGYVDRHPAGETPACPDNEIGYGLSPALWGRGLMPEAVEAVLFWGFETRGYGRVWCGHYAGNWRSRGVIVRCGFRYAFSRSEFVPLMGEWRQCFDYVQTREDWRERISGAV
jgi:Acetyltransferases, including N-acetylases of ribosomal proteins